ncbi:MAG: DUF3047 domain-containing protein [Parvibaculum sp.]|nr:DUF3047 domain-containing protein [Parvibaculum sp.]
MADVSDKRPISGARKEPGLAIFPTLLRLALRAFLSRLRTAGEDITQQEPDFEASMKRLTGNPDVATHIAQLRVLTLTGDASGWQAAGINVNAGDKVTVLGTGSLWASKLFNLRFGPRIGLWLRIGEAGAIFKTPSEASTLTMASGGPLHMVAKPPGEWADAQGRFDPAYPRQDISGEIRVCVIVWKSDPVAGLRAMLKADPACDQIIASALEEAIVPVSTPRGWTYLWRLGQGAIYRDVKTNDSRHIHCHTHQDVGILQFPADFALTENTRLTWRWKADKLPCDMAENIMPTHDYLSIAVEFDNGLDLTYMWSSTLAEGTIFQCPLPFWDKVETHWVLRSNPKELGKWLSEERPVRADYARAIGEPPARIVRVWLIAVSVFQRGEGICDYADIELVDGERRLKIT